MVGNPTIEKLDGKPVLVISIKVNVNQKSLVIEEMLRQRQSTIVAIHVNLMTEVKFDQKIVSDAPAPPARLERELEAMQGRDPGWFNVDSNFKDSLCRLLDLKEEEISAFVKGDPSLQDDKVRAPAGGAAGPPRDGPSRGRAGVLVLACHGDSEVPGDGLSPHRVPSPVSTGSRLWEAGVVC